MSSLGKSINLYLMDGSASGRWQATLSNWNGVAYKIPRDNLKNCDDLPELNAPGVYFLFGKDEGAEKPFIYVGEADDIRKRLLQPHTFEKDGSSWTEAVILVTPDGTLEKGRVKYLENRFYTIAVQAKRYIVKNGNTPPQSPMPKQISDLLEAFILNTKLLLSALGFMVFEQLPPHPSKKDTGAEDELLYFSRKNGEGGSAVGRITADGFWVLKGSYIHPQVASYVASGIKKARERYRSKIDKNGRLQEDVLFHSLSYAAAFVCGRNSNGLIEWKNKEGIPLKDLESETKIRKKSQPVSEHPAASDPASEVLHLTGKKVSATGVLNGEGIIVRKGSGFCSEETKACQNWIRKLRAGLLADKKVVDGVFTEDVYFHSVSAAAGCILGRAANGRLLWRYPDHQNIRDKENVNA